VHSLRRTVYLPVVRNDLPAIYQLFDFGDSLAVNGRRSSTNVAPQALFMMNSPLVQDAAKHTAELLLAGCDRADERELLQRHYILILGRPPREGEIEPSLALVRAALAESTAGESTAESTAAESTVAESDDSEAAPGSAVDRAAQVRAWAMLSHALFCSTSFQFLD
jgi:hypothetical protein